MEDALIGFEVAKLAKEKGFNLNSQAYYGCDDPSSGFVKPNQLFLREWENWTNFGNEDSPQEGTAVYSAPTQSLLQRWLREEHGLIISIEPTFTYALTTNVGYYAYVKKVNKEINTLEYLYLDIYFSATYEESLEIGLLEALKLI